MGILIDERGHHRHEEGDGIDNHREDVVVVEVELVEEAKDVDEEEGETQAGKVDRGEISKRFICFAVF